MPVIAAIDTRVTQGWHWIQVRILPGIAASFACETQDFASLLSWRHHYKCWKRQDVICGLTKVETQDFASHKQGCAINWGDYMPGIAAFSARETQDFASLLGWRHHYFNTKKCASVCDSVFTHIPTHSSLSNNLFPFIPCGRLIHNMLKTVTKCNKIIGMWQIKLNLISIHVISQARYAHLSLY